MNYPEYLHSRVSEMLAYQSQKAIDEAQPFALYRPLLIQDGDLWFPKGSTFGICSGLGPGIYDPKLKAFVFGRSVKSKKRKKR